MTVREVVRCPELVVGGCGKMVSDILVPERFSGISAETVNIVFQDKQKHATPKIPFFSAFNLKYGQR